MAERYDAGIVTAYGAAVRGGYTGTYDEFCAQQANYAQTAAAVEQAKTDAQAAAQRAQDVADSIPEDYTELTEEVGDLKDDFGDIQFASSKFSYTGAHSSTKDKATLSAKAGDVISVICKLSVDPVAENLSVVLYVYDGDTGYFLQYIPTDTFQTTILLDHDCDSFGVYGSVTSNSVDIELYIFNNGSAINLLSNNNEYDIEQMSKNGFAFFDEKYFKSGSLSNGDYVNIATRICNHPHIFTYPYDLHLTADAGYRFGVHTMTADGSFVSDSGWQTDYIIPSGTPFKIVIAKSPDSAVPAYVYEFVKSVHFLTNSAQKIADMASGNLIKTLSVPWYSSMHRGYSSSTVANNTKQAVYRSYLNGANWVEVDARLSSDSVYVINHDATVTVGGTTYTIANETASILTSLVLSTDPVYGECKIPTLESILKICCYTGMSINIDCKVINAETLAKLVVDCGMSGRAVYGNTSIANAVTILGIDPNAGFVFPYSDLASWEAGISDYHVRKRSYAYTATINNNSLEAVRAKGFKIMLTSATSTAGMSYVPDMVEFEHSANCRALNASYISGLELL